MCGHCPRVLQLMHHQLRLNCSFPSTDSPQFFPATDTATPTERQLFTYSFSIDANPPATNDNIALTKNDVTVTDTRFTVNATSLTIADVIRDDSGVYQITASNVAGSGSSTVTVDVYCECIRHILKVLSLA